MASRSVTQSALAGTQSVSMSCVNRKARHSRIVARKCRFGPIFLGTSRRLGSRTYLLRSAGMPRNVTSTRRKQRRRSRSEEHTSELQSLMRSSYAVSCLKKKKQLLHTNSIANHYNRSINDLQLT